MKIKSYKYLETIGTIFWLAMDYCWMSEYKSLSETFSVIASICLFFAFITFDEEKMSDGLAYCASFLWCLMNTFWMYSDYMKAPDLMRVAQVIFGFASLIVILIIFLNKKENKQTEIKRFKIK